MAALADTQQASCETEDVESDLLTTAELAAVLRVSVVTVQGWARTGIIHPALRLPGGQMRWRLAEVERQLSREGH